MRTGPTNQHLQALIAHLKRESYAHDAPIWHRIACDLEKPTRQRRAVNLSRVQRFADKDTQVVVPGKLLGSGALDKALIIAAFDFSQSAREQIEKAKGKAITITELLKANPTGKGIRIIG